MRLHHARLQPLLRPSLAAHLQAETRGGTGQRGGSSALGSSDEGGGSFGDFIGGDLPKKLALLLVGWGVG